jgi:tetratricopeptide (TPR) repeat protein
LNLFKVELALDHPEEAWEHLLTAVRLNPNHVGALEQMALFLKDTDRREEAVTRLRGVIQEHPEISTPWKVLAGLYNESGERLEELKTWEEAYRCFAEDPEILVGYTAALGLAGRPEEVVEILSPRIEKLPFELMVNLVVALGRMGRRVEAREQIKRFSGRDSLSQQEHQRAEEFLAGWDKQAGAS